MMRQGDAAAEKRFHAAAAEADEAFPAGPPRHPPAAAKSSGCGLREYAC